MRDIRTYGYCGYETFQMRLFIYFFILILFMSYDYFREVPDAEALDIARVSKRALYSDFAQFFVMLQWVLLCGGIVLGFAAFGYHLSEDLTGQVFFYLCRLVLIYIVLNGIAAICISWLLARSVGRLLGYVCLILFGCMVSPIATEELGYLSIAVETLHEMYKSFLIMPEGLDAWNIWTMFPVNFSIASRSLFWIFLGLLGLVLIGRSRHKRWLAPLLAFVLIWDAVYKYLPASFYNADNSNSITDSLSYDQFAYIIRENVENKEGEGFSVTRYEIKLRLRRLLQASVSLFPEDGGRSEYKMTLYHLYNVRSVTDEKGNALAYDREGDYLTVYSQGEKLESICVDYDGALSNFYANADSANLPGWFAYYPIPGCRTIFENYEYVDNWLEQEAQFDVTVDSRAVVYSDLERLDGNHFAGKSCGVTLLSGFVSETVLKNGVRCIYPCLEMYDDPAAEIDRESWEYVLERLSTEWEEAEKKVMIILPYFINAPERFRDGLLIGSCGAYAIAANLEKTGTVAREEESQEPDMEHAIDFFMTMYQYMSVSEEDRQMLDYAFLKAEWDSYLAECHIAPSTNEDFEAFILQQLGQEEYDRIMGTKQE
nr:hypothetical protein [Lachnospiraceae bacterium]